MSLQNRTLKETWKSNVKRALQLKKNRTRRKETTNGVSGEPWTTSESGGNQWDQRCGINRGAPDKPPPLRS